MRIALLTLLVVFTAGCSSNTHSKEYYRRIVGEFSMSLMVTSLHLNEVVVGKANNGAATERDVSRIKDSLSALRRHQRTLERMLADSYQRADLRKRDEMVLPLVEDILASTEYLLAFLAHKRQADLDYYFKFRDSFVKKAKSLKKSVNDAIL